MRQMRQRQVFHNADENPQLSTLNYQLPQASAPRPAAKAAKLIFQFLHLRLKPEAIDFFCPIQHPTFRFAPRGAMLLRPLRGLQPELRVLRGSVSDRTLRV
jgi:hypothetical protein